MLVRTGIERAAVAVRDHARKVAESVGPHIELANVTSIGSDGSVQVGIMGTSLIADSTDDLTLSQFVAEYHKKYGLEEDDTLLMMSGGDGAWLAFDVFSTKHVSGAATLAQVLAAGSDAEGAKITGLGSPLPGDVGSTAVTKDYADTESINTQTGASYTLAATDAGGIVRMSYPGNATVFIPRDDQVGFIIGTKLRVADVSGVGTTSIAGADGTVQVNSLDDSLLLSGQYAYVWLIKVGVNQWEVSGDLAHGTAHSITTSFAGTSSLSVTLSKRSHDVLTPSFLGTSTLSEAIVNYRLVPVTIGGQTTLSIVVVPYQQATPGMAGTSGLSLSLGTGRDGYVKQVGVGTSTTGATSHTVPVTLAPAAGNLLILSIANTNATPTGVSDTKGNTWQLDESSGASVALQVWSTMQNAGALTSGDAITVTYGSTVFSFAAAIHEVKGYTNSPVDTVSTANSGATSQTPRSAGSLTTANADDFLWGAFSAGGVETSFTPGSGWTTPVEGAFYSSGAGGLASIEFEYQVTGATGTFTVSGTGGASVVEGGVGVAYQKIGAAVTFVSVTNWSRPSFTQTRTVTFTSLAGLNTAMTNLTDGDLIQYAGTGVLTISSSSSNAFSISGKKPATKVVIDFGTRASIWDSSHVSGNYVEFNCTSTSNLHGLFLFNNSNLTLYGGSFTTSGGTGIYTISTSGGLSNVTHWDFYCHDTHQHGLFVAPGSSSVSITNCSFRGECTTWGGNVASPSWDSHSEKGTGIHACLVSDVGSSGAFTGNTVVIYGHDCACGNGMEIGQSGGGPISSNTFYCKAVNLTKVSVSQVGGAVYPLWGNVSLGSNTVGWAEGINIQGPVIDVDNGALSTLTNGLVVSHGRHTNTNQNTAEFGTNPFPTSFGIVYHDTT